MSEYFTLEDSTTLIYYQMPKVLIHGDEYKKLKGDAKILYVVCLDLVKLSIGNNWIDDEGRVYIKLSLESIKKLMDCSNDKAVSLKKALLEFGLLEEKRLGQGKTNRIYLKKLKFTETDVVKAKKKVEESVKDERRNLKSENQSTDHEIRKSDSKKSENQISRTPEIRDLELRKSEVRKNAEPQRTVGIDGDFKDPIKNNYIKNDYIKKNNKKHYYKKSTIDGKDTFDLAKQIFTGKI